MMMLGPRNTCVLATVVAIASLSGCASGSATPSALLAAQQDRSHARNRASECPCLYVADEDSASVTVYAEGATGNATPIQTISGFYTGLTQPTDVAVDASGDIYVTNHDGGPRGAEWSVTVYAPGIGRRRCTNTNDCRLSD